MRQLMGIKGRFF